MDELRDLYREVIFNPTTARRQELSQARALTGLPEGFNPLCGDQLSPVSEVSDQDVIGDVSFGAVVRFPPPRPRS